MNSTQLRNTYSKFGNKELLLAAQRPSDYHPEAFAIIQEIIEQRGGTTAMLADLEAASIHEMQIQKLRKRFQSQLESGVHKSIEDISEGLDRLTLVDIEQIQNEEAALWAAQKREEKVTFRSGVLGLIGAIIGALVGGSVAGLMMIGSGRVFSIFIFGVVVLCYASVRLISGKGIRNIATLLYTAFSIAAAFAIGSLLYSYFGPVDYLPK